MGGRTINTSRQYLVGPCKGMTLMKFKKPEKKNDDENEKICGPGQLPYEAFNDLYPDACAVYCVPNSDCEGKILRGEMKQYNISHRGNCKEKGFTEPAELTLPELSFFEQIGKSVLAGPCKEMTLMKFKKPGKKNDDIDEIQETENEKLCGPGELPYDASHGLNSDACAVYCVPNSKCEGKIQRGEMKKYKIFDRGSCKKKGFTEPARLTLSELSFFDHIGKSVLVGPCKEMTLMKFKKPENK